MFCYIFIPLSFCLYINIKCLCRTDLISIALLIKTQQWFYCFIITNLRYSYKSRICFCQELVIIMYVPNKYKCVLMYTASAILTSNSCIRRCMYEARASIRSCSSSSSGFTIQQKLDVQLRYHKFPLVFFPFSNRIQSTSSIIIM